MAGRQQSTTRRFSANAGRVARAALAGARRWAVRLLLVAFVVMLLPFALTAIYAIPETRPVSMLMVADTLTLRGHEREWRSLDELGDPIIHSVMMSEDGRYCAHGGVDWDALNLVIEDARAGEPLRGASTIPMQTVKNLFLWHGRSYLRKAMEVPLALYLDWMLSKRRTMEIYLNIAEWAPGIYGAEAAAQHHFGRPAAQLTARQAALLAVTLPNPADRDPANPGPGLSRLAATVEARALQAGAYVECLEHFL